MLTAKLVLLLIGGVVTAVGGVGAVIWGPYAKARRRLHAGSTRLEDRAIVTLTGVVRALGEPLVAPLSGKPCVACRSFASWVPDRRVGGDRGGALAHTDAQPFELVTDEGPVIVDGALDFAIRPAAVVPCKLERQARFLAMHGQSVEFMQRAGFEEILIAPGDRISVQGMVMIEASPVGGERGFRDTAVAIRLVPHDDHPLTIGEPRRR